MSQEVGYDAAKAVKGRKQFVTVDTLSLGLRVLVTAADVGEREGGKQVLQKVKQMGKAVHRLHTIWVDGGFDGVPFAQWVIDVSCWIVQVVLRPKERKGFVLLHKRWVVKRTLGGLAHCRRLSRDHEVLPQTSETFIPDFSPGFLKLASKACLDLVLVEFQKKQFVIFHHSDGLS